MFLYNQYQGRRDDVPFIIVWASSLNSSQAYFEWLSGYRQLVSVCLHFFLADEEAQGTVEGCGAGIDLIDFFERVDTFVAQQL